MCGCRNNKKKKADAWHAIESETDMRFCPECRGYTDQLFIVFVRMNEYDQREMKTVYQCSHCDYKERIFSDGSTRPTDE